MQRALRTIYRRIHTYEARCKKREDIRRLPKELRNAAPWTIIFDRNKGEEEGEDPIREYTRNNAKS